MSVEHKKQLLSTDIAEVFQNTSDDKKGEWKNNHNEGHLADSVVCSD